MDANSYLSQRLAAIGSNDSELEALKAENAQLKKRLGQMPAANFKSTAQTAFESSPEFESILNAYFVRFIRDKFGAEFRNSPYMQEFQETANKAFERFEKNYKKDDKEAPQNATPTGKKGRQTDGGSNASSGQTNG